MDFNINTLHHMPYDGNATHNILYNSLGRQSYNAHSIDIRYNKIVNYSRTYLNKAKDLTMQIKEMMHKMYARNNTVREMYNVINIVKQSFINSNQYNSKHDISYGSMIRQYYGSDIQINNHKELDAFIQSMHNMSNAFLQQGQSSLLEIQKMQGNLLLYYQFISRIISTISRTVQSAVSNIK